MTNDSTPQHCAGPNQELLVAKLRALADGDIASLTVIYEATAGRVHALAYRIARDAAVAEDVTANVYLEAWRRAREYDPARGSVLGWLLVVCRSRALDAVRAQSQQRAQAHPDGPPDLGGDDPCDLLEATRRSSRMHEGIAALLPVQRQMLALAFFRGHTHSEIAALLQMPLGSVKSHIKRALQLLREHLGEESGR